jgi:tRNA(fMet)-specific endonuclease VapC
LTTFYLLDTNILTDMARNPFGPCAHQLQNVGSDNVFTSVIAASEIQFGIEKFRAFRLLRQMERILETIEIRPLPIEVISTYSIMRADLEQRGLPVSANDMWIAAHAIAEDAVLVSNNLREFSRIQNLKVENWMQAI